MTLCHAGHPAPLAGTLDRRDRIDQRQRLLELATVAALRFSHGVADQVASLQIHSKAEHSSFGWQRRAANR